MDRWITDTDPHPTFGIYTRANAGEVYPDPMSPLSATLAFMRAGEQGWRDTYLRYTLDADEIGDAPGTIIGCFGGYLYLNMSLTRLYGVRMPGMTPEMVDQQYFGTMPGIPPYVPRPGDESEVHSARLDAWLAQAIMIDDLPNLRADRDEVAALVGARPAFELLDEFDLVARARGFGSLYRRLFDQHISASAASGVGASIVGGVCAAIGRPELAMVLLSGLGDVDSAAPSYALWAMGRMVAASNVLPRIFDDGVESVLEALGSGGHPDIVSLASAMSDFTSRFGSRGPSEWELRSETWGTRPATALAAIDRMRLADDGSSPQRLAALRVAEADAAAAEVTAMLAGDSEARDQFLAGLRSGRAYLAGRERTKTTIVKIVHEMRLATRELGRRCLDEPSLVFMCLDEELERLIHRDPAVLSALESRERDYLSLYDLEPPFIVDGVVPPLSSWARRGASGSAAAAGTVLSGIPGCPGVATGRAAVVLDPADPEALAPGDVLVAPITDPAWTPLFLAASAVVVDVGAQVSHAVIVSRELGIPCVVSVTGATRSIVPGSVVSVDGSAGTVTVVSVPA